MKQLWTKFVNHHFIDGKWIVGFGWYFGDQRDVDVDADERFCKIDGKRGRAYIFNRLESFNNNNLILSVPPL